MRPEHEVFSGKGGLPVAVCFRKYIAGAIPRLRILIDSWYLRN
jgi:hypothetical protein